MNRGKRQEWISDIYLRIREINRMQEKNSRNQLIRDITSEITFMYYQNALNGTEYHRLLNKISLNEYQKMSAKEYDASCRMLSFHSDFFGQLYTVVCSIYENYFFYYHNLRFNENEMQEALLSFLEYIGCFELFKNIKDNNMIWYYANKIKKDSSGLCLPKESLSYIILGQNPKSSLEYYMNIIYEIGIAYVNKVLYTDKITFNQYKCFYYFIPSTFCRMFFDFLIKQKVFDITKIHLMQMNNEVSNYKKIVDAMDVSAYLARKDEKGLNSRKYEGMVKRVGKDISPFIIQEAFGTIASCNIFLEYKKCPSDFILDLSHTIKELRKKDFRRLLELYGNTESIKEVLDESIGRCYTKK